jgi:CMP-N-acetylneuraminic acid synthetase
MNIMGFIPARGGSKGIPRKNMVLLNKKPLIQYTIEAAQESNYIDQIFVSTEDEEIARFCESLGVSVPYRRPVKLATDESTIIEAIMDALEWLKDSSLNFPDSIMLLQPTSPLRRPEDIDGAVELFQATQAESLISVHRMVEHPYDCLRIEKNGWSFLAKPPSGERLISRQDYPEEFYYINGAIYLAKTEFLVRKKSFVVEGETALYFMNPADGVDIDDMFDLKRAEFYIQFCTESIS